MVAVVIAILQGSLVISLLMVLSIVMVVLQVTRFVGACWCWSSFTVGGKRGDDMNTKKGMPMTTAVSIKSVGG